MINNTLANTLYTNLDYTISKPASDVLSTTDDKVDSLIYYSLAHSMYDLEDELNTIT